MSISERLDQIAARANAATEGPWEAHVDRYQDDEYRDRDGAWIPGIADKDDDWDYGGRLLPLDPADAEFISSARTDVPDMLSALRAVLAINTGDNRRVYGIDFEAGMCKALAIVHQTITAALGEGS